MRQVRLAAVALATAFAATGAFAQTSAPTADEHTAHHPDSAASAPAIPAAPPAAPDSTAAVQAHMKAMRDLHDRMLQARTPKQREALMAEHRQLMQEGMALMGAMRPGGMGGMGAGPGMGGMGAMAPAGAASAAPMELAARQRMLEQRMDMMQSMMQMMSDCMGPARAGR